jgi:hypothetical protein
MKRLACTLLLAGSVSSVSAEPEPCLAGGASITKAELIDRRVDFCDDNEDKPVCLSVDLTTGAARKRGAGASLGMAIATIEVGTRTAKVCQPGGKPCKTLKPKARVDEGLGMSGVVNDMGTLAVLLNLEQVETFDAKTGKRIAQFKSGTASCATVSFVGDETLYVWSEDCGGGDGTSWLATKKGKKIAIVGGDKPIEAMPPVLLEKTRAAFVSERGDVLVVQDITSGAVEKRLALGVAVEETMPTVLGSGSRAVVVYGGKRAGDVVVVDLATDKVTTHPGKRCTKK